MEREFIVDFDPTGRDGLAGGREQVKVAIGGGEEEVPRRILFGWLRDAATITSGVVCTDVRVYERVL